jgi:PE-PPE domain-containing protein
MFAGLGGLAKQRPPLGMSLGEARMAGKHRKSSRRRSSDARSSAARRGGSGLAAAAVGATSLSTALITGTSTAVAPSVELVALITPANSTAQIFAGATYYGTDYTKPPASTTYGPQQVVPFFLGPQGIADAISAADGHPTVVLASGWGAGQTGTALGQLRDNHDPALDDIKLVILDNNTNRAGGGFWTTYAPFAPLLGTSAAPTPSNLGVPALDVAYEYNINSDAPVDPLNPFALGNSLAAYIFGYGAQSTAVIPTSVMNEAQSTDATTVHHHYVLDTQGNIVGTYDLPKGTTTTYVTIQADDLPLTRPLRLIPGGDIVADALDPTLTELVNAGYNDGKGIPGSEAIPKDPTVTRPMQPGSSIGALGDVPGTLQTGLDAGEKTAQDDLESPPNLVTKPLGKVGTLPVLGSLALPNSTLTTNKLSTTSGNLFAPGSKKPGSTASPCGANPVKTFTDRINDAVNEVTGGSLQKDKPADSTDPK